jgi:iron complex transport system substrate-binding protein
MKTTGLRFFCSLALLAFAGSAGSTEVATKVATKIDTELRDATGEAVIAARPQRVVTLAPSLAELASEFLGSDLKRVVGVADRTDYPAAMQGKTNIGPFSSFSMERVVSLKPDLVLATMDGNPKDRVLRLRALGLHVVVVQDQSFAQIEEAIRIIGVSLGEPGQADQKARTFHDGVLQFKQRANTRKTAPQVLLQLGSNPLVVAGRNSFLNEMLEQLGAGNVYGDLKQSYPKPSFEDALTRNPTHILVISMGASTASAAEEIATWQKFPKLRAIKAGQLKALPGDLLLRPSFRLLEGLKLMEAALFEAGGPASGKTHESQTITKKSHP